MPYTHKCNTVFNMRLLMIYRFTVKTNVLLEDENCSNSSEEVPTRQTLHKLFFFTFLCVRVNPCFQGLAFVFNFQNRGDCLTCNSGSPTKRRLQVTDIDSGRRIHVPVLKSQLFFFRFEMHWFSLSILHHGKVAKTKNHPCRLTSKRGLHENFPDLN